MTLMYSKGRVSLRGLLVLSSVLAAGILLLLHQHVQDPYTKQTPRTLWPGSKGLHGISAAHQSCWQCIQPEWRKHFIFANSTKGHLDACPDSSSWPPGLWTAPSTRSGVDSAAAVAAVSWSPPVGMPHQRPAVPGEPAVLPATLMAQQAIWRNQHPADCSKAKFVVYEAIPSGFGSVLHAQGAALSAAMETGRVFLEAPGNDFAATSYCGSNTTLDTCYFLPLSNCSLEEAGVTTKELNTAPVLALADLTRYAASDPASPRVVLMSIEQTATVRTFTPLQFSQALDAAGLPTSRRYWWWRAQAVAFIVRPNVRTQREIVQRKEQKLRGMPLQTGCISMFVRHGDKVVEAKVWDDAAYEAAAQQLREIDSSLTRQLFLATDDPASITYFNSTARNLHTTVLEMKLRPDPTKPLNKWGDMKGLDLGSSSEETLDFLTTLDLSLSCDGFVASFLSNWARLIQELRSTVRCKAHRVFLDVGTELMHDPAVGGLDLNW